MNRQNVDLISITHEIYSLLVANFKSKFLDTFAPSSLKPAMDDHFW